ncbi:Cna B-type domain-containing protein [Cytobacillus oceanisediminis]|uniref:Cna B-type domain-containing protein n=1 Tax=Cytobacillus oceanisediminis TaxID=665099 RepID=UPI00207A10F9|nr:Cna B-type domain-containing protein [Cytobacillus oceanisediminis]USK43597.1 Cna B-type domain-containing protein [Cytobacillus oceanisediminis]
MSKKVSIIMFILILVSQTVLSGSGLSYSAVASEAAQGFLTDVNMTDDKGNLIDSERNPDYQSNAETAVNVNYHWSLEGLKVTSGDTYSFKIPKEIKIQNEQQGKLIAADVELGSFYAGTDGAVVVTFYEEVENYAGTEGMFTIKTFFSSDMIKDNETVSIPFALSAKEKIINVAFQVDPISENNQQQDETPASVESDEKTEAHTGDLKDEVKVETDAEAAEEEQTEDKVPVLEKSTKEEKIETNQSNLYEPVEIQENIITDFELTLRDGTPLPDPLPNPNEHDIELKAKYSFALANDHTYRAGSTYTFKLPEQLTVYNQASGKLGEYGTFTVSTDGTVVFTFNENIEAHSDIDGWIEVYSLIDRHLEGGTTQKIVVPIKGETVKELILNFEPKNGNSIDKRGTPNQKYNASSIAWEIDFNKNQDVLAGAQLLDPIDDPNQEFIAGSMKIYKLDVQLNGSVNLGEEVTEKYKGTFPIDFGNINRDAYRVVFDTRITDSEATNYQNHATIKWKDGELSAGATVNVGRGKALEKRSSHYDSKSQTITWEVKYNYNQKEISKDEAVLTDIFGENQVLVEDSFEVREITINPETGAEAGEGEIFNNYSITKNGNKGFQLQFGQDIQTAYKITYKTKADERVYENSTVSNKITANGKEATGSRTMIQEVFHKYHYNQHTDYNNKTTRWGISFNKDSHTMENVTLTDTLPKGLKLENYTIKHGGEALVKDEHYEYSYNEETGEVVFNFTGLNPVTKEVYIEYTTSFDFNMIDKDNESFTNLAKLTWTPEGEEEQRSEERKATFTPNKNTQLNGSKSGSYNAKTKEITWTIGVNYNNRNIKEAIVEDLIQGNQNLDLGSIEVYQMLVQSNGNWSKGEKLSSDQYGKEEFESEGKPGFRVNLGEINSPYVIEFKTNLAGELIVNRYNNEALLKDGAADFPLNAHVSVANGGTYTTKDAAQNGQNEEVLNWSVRINAAQSMIENPKLIDRPSANQLILKDSFVLYGTTVHESGSFTKNTEDILKEGTDYSIEFKKDEEGKEYFELLFSKTIDRPYILEYDTFLMAGHGEEVSNHALIEGKNITTEKTDTKKQHIVRYSAGDGGASGKVGKLTIKKVDAATEEPLQGVEFTLFDKSGTIALFTEKTDSKGEITFDQLRFGDYVLKETKVPEGYVSFYVDGKVITIDQEVNSPEDTGNIHKVENHPIIYAVQLTKVDEANPDTKLEGAAFELQKQVDGEFVTITDKVLTNNKGIIYVDDLTPGKYQFIEKTAPYGYLLDKKPVLFTIQEEAIEVVEVTAANKGIEIMSIKGQKVWKDEGPSERPESIYVDLLQNNKVIETLKVSEDSQWSYSFNDLLKTDSLGNAYKYAINEHPVPGYESIVDGYDITNLRIGKTSVEGAKIWKDDNSPERPESIMVNLLQNGEVIDSREVTSETNWTYSFTGLEKYDLEGKAYEYTVEEEPVKGYESAIDGYDITNLRVGKTSVEGSKIWKDDNSPERPKSITVNLLQNGEVIDSQEVTAETDWTYSFIDLNKYDEEGKAYQYTVKELPVQGYESTIEDHNITNVRTGKTAVEGIKTWKDGNSKDRPSKIKVNLLQNGVVIDTQEVTAKTDWTYHLTDLEKYDQDGKAYNYTVKEQGVPGYESKVDGYNITNTRSEQTSAVITKGWKDDNSEDRPESVTVKLLQNGKVMKTVELKAIEGWTYKFKDLEAYDEDGIAYEYTVEEEAVEGYESKVDGYDITNVRVGKTTVEGLKTWKDDNSKDRPVMIKVDLLQNDKVIATQETTAETDWKFSFTDLEKYDEEGKAYHYTVKEQPVQGYESTVEDHNITNVRTGKTTVEGTKTWKDGNSKDRPSNIKVNLLQNGVVIDTQEVTAKTDWTYQFTDLEKYDEDGKSYNYSVKEQGVPGYKSKVDGFDITNTRSEQTSAVITKSWKDDNSEERPESVTVNLLQNGKVIETVELKASEGWTYDFKGLEAYDEDGIAYEYTVKEEAVEGYESKITGYDITNVRIGQTSVEGTKIWKDDNFKNRPKIIVIDLLRNGKIIHTQEVTADTGWKYSFPDLEKYDQEGKAYAYTVKEHPVKGYESIISDYNITNKLILGTVELTKVDSDNHQIKLEGAVFKLQDAEGTTLKEGLTTDSNGKLVIDDLKPGNYQFIETKAPEGYELDPSPASFTIETGQHDKVTVIAENHKKPENGAPGVDKPQGPADLPGKPDTTKPATPGTPVNGNGQLNSNTGNILPDTATSIFNSGLIGILLLLAGLLLTVRRKKKLR